MDNFEGYDRKFIHDNHKKDSTPKNIFIFATRFTILMDVIERKMELYAVQGFIQMTLNSQLTEAISGIWQEKFSFTIY